MSSKYCSPTKKYDPNVKTCFDIKDLISIANAYNKWRKNVCNDNKCISKDTFKKINNVTSLPKNELYQQIKERLNILGKNEYQWLELDFMKSLEPNSKNEILYFTFKPKSTKTIKTWFNTDNINEILQQYQSYINDTNGKNFYRYIGAQPADISRVYSFDWNELQNKYKCISIVFNTDKHNKKGQHWVCCFIDNRYRTVEYFDSLGKMPNKYIREFLAHFEEEYTFRFNKKAFQQGGTNCGMYSCFFTIQKLKGMSFEDIIKKFNKINPGNMSPDKMMSKYRSQVFRPYL